MERYAHTCLGRRVCWDDGSPLSVNESPASVGMSLETLFARPSEATPSSCPPRSVPSDPRREGRCSSGDAWCVGANRAAVPLHAA